MIVFFAIGLVIGAVVRRIRGALGGVASIASEAARQVDEGIAAGGLRADAYSD